MSYALVSNVQAAGANTFTSGAIDTSGASLIVVAITESGANSVTLSDSKGNTWFRLTQRDLITGSSQLCLAYAKNPTVGSGHTFTATGSSFFAVLSVAAFSGADLTSPFDQEGVGGGGAGSSTGQQSGSVTPSADNELIISAAAWSTSITVTSVTGMTLIGQTDFAGGTNYGGGIAYAVQTTATTVNPAWNWTGGAVASNFDTATFKVAAGGGGGGDLFALIGEPICGSNMTN